ncbi:MAG: type I glutamate--ammonia ligase [Bacteroidetes bacterium]|nr:type I glutamate--ammonia ligase [Bacteroidota bacterium]
MSEELQHVKKLIEEHHIEFLDLKTLDLVGRLHHITLPLRDGTLDCLMEQGVGFDGSSFGFVKVESSDMVQKPDLSTVQIDLFRDRPTLTCFTNVFLTDEKRSRFPQDVRWVAFQAEELLRRLGIADATHWGPELEYYIFSHVEFDTRTSASYYKVDHAEEFFQNAYHACSPFDLYDDFRDESCRLLEKAGIPVKYHHHEVGERGQQEIEFLFESLLKSADSITMAKYILFSQAAEEGLEVTFMPKPMYQQAGSGLHVHQYLTKNGENIFYKAGEYANFNETGLYYIGGLLKHAPALAAFTNPSTNSYKRLVPGFEAPVALTYSQANRSSCVRIPRYISDPKETRMEYRPSDATANPYLMLAAMLMAGIDGIVNKIDPRKEGFGPYDENVFANKDLHFLPRNLAEALDALEADNDFLQREGVFPQSLITQWLKTKREEVHAISTMPHPFEYKMYFHR